MAITSSQQALAQLQKAQAGAQSPDSLLAAQQKQLGVQNQRDTVGGLRTAVNNTTNLLKQVAPSVMGRTSGSLVTNAQATRQIANEQAPIATNLTDQNMAYSQAAQDLASLEAQAAQAAQTVYGGQTDRLSYLQNLYNSLYQKEVDDRNFAEQQRQFNEQLAESRRASAASANSGIDYGSLIGALTNQTSPQAKSPVSSSEQKLYSRAKSLQNLYSSDIGQFNKTVQSLLSKFRSGDKSAKNVILTAYKLLGKENANALKNWGLK